VPLAPADRPDPAGARRSRWLPGQPDPGAVVRLFCFPHAGGGASTFRGWPEELEGVDVCPVQLPGREGRLLEPAFTDLRLLASTLATVLAPHLRVPFALFGHSMGAMIAFELARRLRREGVVPLHLFAAGHGAPDAPDTSPPVHALPQTEFLERLRAYAGTPEAVFQSQELLQHLLPALRADFALFETYRYQPEAPLPVPITVFGGRQDASVAPERLQAWERHTSGPFRLVMLPGDHFFPSTARPQLLAAIRASLDARLAQAPGGVPR
jgi:medium-chain acyl-[acyl-carrier-protein] hydrolase